MKHKKKLAHGVLEGIFNKDPWFMASNINTPIKKLKTLGKNKNLAVRRALAENPSTPPDILIPLLRDSVGEIKYEAASRLLDLVRKGLKLRDKDLMDVVYVFEIDNFEALKKFNELKGLNK